MILNKKGWGLREMLLLSGVLILFLVIAIYYIYTLYDSMGKEITLTNYKELEEKLEEQTLIYLNDYYDDNLNSNYITITSSVLRSYNLDVSLVDSKGNSCSGYAVANKSRGIINIDSYIKCDDYETKGYEEWRLN